MARMRWRPMFLSRKARWISYMGICVFALYFISQMINANTRDFPTFRDEVRDSGMGIAKEAKMAPIIKPAVVLKEERRPPRLHRRSEMFKQANLSELAMRKYPHRSFREFIPVYKDPELEKVVSYSDIFGGDKVVQEIKFPHVIANSELCSFEKVLAVIYVHSAVGNLEKRNRIRRTWASVKTDEEKKLVSFFLVGSTEDPTTMKNIAHENTQFLDIVQIGVLDNYKNLTYKNLVGLHWVTEFCSHAKFVIKVDDDVLIDPFHLVEYLLRLPHGLENYLICSVMYHIGVPKSPDDKWHIPPREYPFRYYPSYCEGYAYVMSADMAVSLYNMSRYVPYFWIDDVYVTGFLTHRLHMGPKDMVQGHAAVLMSNKMIQPEVAKGYIFFLGLNPLYTRYWYEVWTSIKTIHT